ncbi:MAG: DUF1850 domain-containing protein [Spiribacter sp.]|nr:DUF1850 domain-containing protein [Spiribacter sp.]
MTKAFPVLGAVMALAFTAPAHSLGLEVREARTSERLDCLPLADRAFSLTFIHSVSQTPVEDVYTLEGEGSERQLVQTAEHFVTHGQGLPSMADEPGVTRLEHTDTGFVAHMRRPISKLIIRAHPDFDNTLRADGRRIDLTNWPDRALRIEPVGDCKSNR